MLWIDVLTHCWSLEYPIMQQQEHTIILSKTLTVKLKYLLSSNYLLGHFEDNFIQSNLHSTIQWYNRSLCKWEYSLKVLNDRCNYQLSVPSYAEGVKRDINRTEGARREKEKDKCCYRRVDLCSPKSWVWTTCVFYKFCECGLMAFGSVMIYQTVS